MAAFGGTGSIRVIVGDGFHVRADGWTSTRNEEVTTSRKRAKSDAFKSPDVVSSQMNSVDDRWFRAVADYTYDWESWHAPDGRLVWVNPAVERITGYSVAEC
jgi:PAS domain-containing protein